jgi:hypothetical protein
VIPKNGFGGTVQLIETTDAPSHTGPAPQAVEAGGWIYVSALFGADPTTHVIPADARAEAEQLFANLAAILAAGGAGLTRIRDYQEDDLDCCGMILLCFGSGSWAPQRARASPRVAWFRVSSGPGRPGQDVAGSAPSEHRPRPGRLRPAAPPPEW